MSFSSGVDPQQKQRRRRPPANSSSRQPGGDKTPQAQGPGGRQRKASGAVKSRINVSGRARSWLADHRLVATEALVTLWRKPLANLLTCLVIGIALALPAGFFVGLDNLQRLTSGWSAGARMSVFLKDDTSERQGRELGRLLESGAGVISARYVSREEALEEFSRLSGFAEPLGALSTNPLPALLEVTPLLAGENRSVLHDLQAQLQGRDEVELVQIDLQWVQKLYAMLDLVGQVTLSLAMLLGLGVLLVTVNTVRLAIENRRQEIVVAKLVGATDAFVRRPFLYTGLWYGLGGGLLALCLVFGAVAMVDASVINLAALYGSSFRLSGLAPSDSVSLVVGGALLGWGGAWLAVSRHLGEIVPR